MTGFFNYVMDCDIARTFADKLEDMINFLIPNYVKEGKTNLVIAIGCTGGKHRSVTLARELYSRLSGNTKYGFRLEHRDAQKDRLVRNRKDDKGEMSFSGMVKVRTFQTDWIGQTLQNGRTGCYFMFLWENGMFFKGQ